MDSVVIREATVADADRIGQLWLELVAYHRGMSADMPQASPDGAQSYARQVSHRLDEWHTTVLVAEAAEDGIVGYALGTIVDLTPDMFAREPTGLLADIYVSGAYRRRGIGRLLIGDLMNWFREHGVAYFEWQVAALNAAGRAFWREVGGRETMIRMRIDLGDE